MLCLQKLISFSDLQRKLYLREKAFESVAIVACAVSC